MNYIYFFQKYKKNYSPLLCCGRHWELNLIVHLWIALTWKHLFCLLDIYNIATHPLSVSLSLYVRSLFLHLLPSLYSHRNVTFKWPLALTSWTIKLLTWELILIFLREYVSDVFCSLCMFGVYCWWRCCLFYFFVTSKCPILSEILLF